MKLRTLILICLATVLVVGGTAFAVVSHNKHRYDPVALTDVKTSGKTGLQCLKSNNSLKLAVADQQSIGAAAARHIKDLPSNAQATLNIASFEPGKSATGRVTYGGNLGSYNFELNDVRDYWRVVSFKACDN